MPRKPQRLKELSYSDPGAYFITTVTAHRRNLFNKPTYKQIVEKVWLGLTEHFTGLVLDEFNILSNHFHAIVILEDVPDRPTIPQLMRAFKTNSAREINQLLKTPGNPVWHRSFYDHVIRGHRDLDECRYYVINNELIHAVRKYGIYLPYDP